MQRVEGSEVVLKGHPDVTLDVFARYLRQTLDHSILEIELGGVIHAIHVMRHPTCVTLSAHQFQFWMAFEDPTQDHQTNNILHCANDTEKIVHLVTTMRHAETAVA